MSNYHTTLSKLREAGNWKGRYAYLVTMLDGGTVEDAEAAEAENNGGYKESTSHADHEPIDLATILRYNGIDDALWSLRAMDGGEIDKRCRILACCCAARSTPIFEHHDPSDATDNELDAARKAAWAAALDDMITIFELDMKGTR